jgi:hypothetical protein
VTAGDAEIRIRCIEPVFMNGSIDKYLTRLMTVCAYAYVATYARERSILSATLGITLSKSVSQRRASGHCDMTPNVTGTRRASVDQGCCTSLGIPCAVVRYSERADKTIVESIAVAEVGMAVQGTLGVRSAMERGSRSFQALRHQRHVSLLNHQVARRTLN